MLASSRALWNRTQLVLDSDEVLAQLLDRGSLDDWRELYHIAKVDPEVRRRIAVTIARVPLPMPHFWLSALAALGEHVDHDAALPRYEDTDV
jgi:hypothetical protein